MIPLEIREVKNPKPKTYVIPDDLKLKITTDDHRKPSEVGYHHKPAAPIVELDVKVPTNRGKPPKPGKSDEKEKSSWADLLS